MQEVENNIHRSIIKTLSYSDIFGFPLSAGEIFKYFLGTKHSKKEIMSSLQFLVKRGLICCDNNYFYLNGKSSYCAVRKNRNKSSREKWNIAKKACSVLSLIPTVKLIGISGSLSMNNADPKDDIDLFIVTSKGSLWLSRFLVNLLLIIMGMKRDREDSIGVDQICPNMLVSGENLLMTKNLFVAHEIAQLKVLVNKDNVYEKFLYENKWVLRYMPNAFKMTPLGGVIASEPRKRRGDRSDLSKRLLRPLWGLAMTLIENIFYKFQLAYMKRRITTEKIGLNRAFFHPKDKTQFVIKLYKQRYANYVSQITTNVHSQPQINTFSMLSDTPGY